MSGLYVMVRRQLRVNRISMLVIAVVLTINNVVQVTAYASIFPDPATRATILEGFTSNGALRSLYGYPYDIGNPTGWLSWRSVGFLVLVTAMWAAYVTVGALRGEEEAGRGELALSQPQSRRRWFAAALVAVTIETLFIGAVNVAGMAAICVTQGLMTFLDCLGIALQLMLPAVLFAAVGAVASQLIGTARGARIAAAVVLAIGFFVRTAADTGSGISWLRWATPLGWFEELHPSTTPSLVAVGAILVTFVVLVAAAIPMLTNRDIGLGLLPHRDSRKPRLILLGAPWQAALRDDMPQLSIWLVGSLFYTLLAGSLIKTLLDLVRTNSAFSNLLGKSFAVNAYTAASFSVVELVVTLLVVTMVVGARSEEATGRLELLAAAPLSRIRWLLSRAGLAGGAAVALALVSAVAFWAGAVLTGQDVAFGSVAEAALNCIPLIILTAGASIGVFALAPRAVASMYALLTVVFLWDALGTALNAPTWTLDLSPFHALGAVPRQDFQLLPAALLTIIGIALLAGGTSVFRGRDLAMG